MKTFFKNPIHYFMILAAIIVSLLYYGNENKIESNAEGSYIGNAEAYTVHLSNGGSGNPTIVAGEGMSLFVSLGTGRGYGLNLPEQGGYQKMVDYYKDFEPSVYNSDSVFAVVNKRDINKHGISEFDLAWYNPGDDPSVFRATNTRSGAWKSVMIMDSPVMPGSQIYGAQLKALSDAGNLGQWKTLVNSSTKSASRALWAYFGEANGNIITETKARVAKYQDLASQYIPGVTVSALNFDQYTQWKDNEKQAAFLTHLDLLMTIYSNLADIPSAEQRVSDTIDQYVNTGFVMGTEGHAANIILFPGTFFSDASHKNWYLTGIYDVWSYAYKSSNDNMLASSDFKKIAEITGASSATNLYDRLYALTIWKYGNGQNGGESVALKNFYANGFSYVPNYAFYKDIGKHLTLRKPANTHGFSETLYLNNKGDNGINLIIAPPNMSPQSTQIAPFDAAFKTIWSGANSQFINVDGDNVSDIVGFKVNLKVPDDQKATWNTILTSNNKFSILFNIKSNKETGRVTSTTLDGGATSNIGDAEYYVNGAPYAASTTSTQEVDIGREELRRYLLEGQVYNLLFDREPMHQAINLSEMQQYGYDLSVTIKYGDTDTSKGSLTSSWSGYSYDKTDGARYYHRVIAQRGGTSSTPVITYYSSPEAFAEFKNGTVERNGNGSKEEWEAMAGIPSTETMYFTSGGSEFILEMELEFIEGEKATREYRNTFFGTECEFKRNDQFKASNEPGTAEDSNSFNNDGLTEWHDNFTGDQLGKDTTAELDKLSQTTYMKHSDLADSQTEEFGGHHHTAGTIDSGDFTSFSDIESSESEKAESTTLTASWSGTIVNTNTGENDGGDVITDSPKNDGYIMGGSKGGTTSCSLGTEYINNTGNPGGWGKDVAISWDTSEFKEKFEDAIKWAEYYEAHEVSTDGYGIANKLADSDGVLRVWRPGKATIHVSLSNPSVGDAGPLKQSYTGGNYATGGTWGGTTYTQNSSGQAATTLKDLLAKANNATQSPFGSNKVYKSGRASSAGGGSDAMEGSPPQPVCHHNYGSDGSYASYSARPDITFRITVTFSDGELEAKDTYKDKWIKGDGKYTGSCNGTSANGTLPAHALCGPCCQHNLPQILDTWHQDIQYDYTRINTMRVYKIHRSYTTGGDLDDITLVDYNESGAPGDLNMWWMHGAKSGRYKETNASGQAGKHNGTDTLVAAISQGDPNIFYNIANEQPEYEKTSGSGKTAAMPSMAGRIRYGYQPQQYDWSYVENTTRRGNFGWAAGYHTTAGSRSNKCDGLSKVTSSSNPAQTGGNGHKNRWSNGIIYNTGFSAQWSGSGDEYWMDDIYGNLGTAEKNGGANGVQADANEGAWPTYAVNSLYENTNLGALDQISDGKAVTGYDGSSLALTIDYRNSLTEEYARFKHQRNQKTTARIISDMLILQTSTGDQPVMYYQTAPQVQTCQKHFVYEANKGIDIGHASHNVPSVNQSNDFRYKVEDTWLNNPNCAKNWGANNIGQDGDVNVGSYTGEFETPDNKFSSIINGYRFQTIYDMRDDNRIKNLSGAGGGDTWDQWCQFQWHPLFLTDSTYGTENGNKDNRAYGANTLVYSSNSTKMESNGGETRYMGRNGYDTIYASDSGKWSFVNPANAQYDSVKNYIDETEVPESITKTVKGRYKSSPNMCFTNSGSHGQNFHDKKWNAQIRMNRVNGMRIFTDNILQNPTNPNAEYDTGVAHQTYILIKDYNKSKNFVHKFNKEPVYALDLDDGKTVDGFEMEAPYSRDHDKINNIVVHDPVSAENATIVASSNKHDRYKADDDIYGKWQDDFRRDTRTENNLLGAENLVNRLNELDKCPRDAELCEFRVLNCSYGHDEVLANFDFSKATATKDGSVRLYDNIHNVAYAMPSGWEIDHIEQGDAKDSVYYTDGNTSAKLEANGYYTRYIDTNLMTVGGYNKDLKLTNVWFPSSLFGGAYDNYVKATGGKWRIPLSSLGLSTYDPATKLAVEMNFYKRSASDTGTVLAGFNNYAYIIPSNSKLAALTTGNGAQKTLNNTNFLDQTMKIKMVFDFHNPSDSKFYINGKEVTNYSITSLPGEVNSTNIGDSLYIGGWGRDNSYQASFYFDNLKITKLAGGREHTDACYSTIMDHTKTIQYTCQTYYSYKFDELKANQKDETGEPYMHIVPTSGKYKLEVFGAQGGGADTGASSGGLGGYTYGYMHLNKGQKLLMYPGGRGKAQTEDTRIEYFWIVPNGCGAEGALKAASNGTEYVESYINSYTATTTAINGYMQGVWATEPPASVSCSNHSTSPAIGKDGQPIHRIIGNGNYAGQVNEFGFTGGVQVYKVPITGTYKLEAWGAQGCIDSGSHETNRGGYTWAETTLNAGDMLYIAVGGQGTSPGWNPTSDAYKAYNGGGRPGAQTGNGGGGATHIAITNRGELKNYQNYQNEVLIVAGGGGGEGDNSYGGAGGGGNNNGTNGDCGSGGTTNHGFAFGQGQDAIWADQVSGGGSGWYGGYNSGGRMGGSGGGSGHIRAGLNGGGITGEHYGNGYAKITCIAGSGKAYRNTSSAGWNGGGAAMKGAGAVAYGGGGASDIRVLRYGGIYAIGNQITRGGEFANYGPYIEAGAGHYQADIYGTNLDKTDFDVYSNAWTEPNHEIAYDDIFINPTHVTIYFTLDDAHATVAGGYGLEVRTFDKGGATVNRLYISRLEDRVIVAGGGGGGDNDGGILGGSDDGRGGAGGGSNQPGTAAFVEGVQVPFGSTVAGFRGQKSTLDPDGDGYWEAKTGILASGCGQGGQQTKGYRLGIGESASYPWDVAGAGGGYYGGYVTNHNNGGAGGGSAYVDTSVIENGTFNGSTGTNSGNGVCTIHMISHEPSTDTGANGTLKLMEDYNQRDGKRQYKIVIGGMYELEVWGANGSGGPGGYTSGRVYLAPGQIIDVYTGKGGGSSYITPQNSTESASYVQARGNGDRTTPITNSVSDVNIVNGPYRSASQSANDLSAASGNMPTYDHNGVMQGNSGEGHASIYMIDRDTDRHTAECTYVQSINNYHEHDASCVSYDNAVLNQAIRAYLSNDETLLEKFLGQSAFAKFKATPVTTTISGWDIADWNSVLLNNFRGQVKNGDLILTSTNPAPNPHMNTNGHIQLTGSMVSSVRVNCEVVGKRQEDNVIAQLFFKTNSSGNNQGIIDAIYDGSGFTFYGNTAKNVVWSGEITNLSFDLLPDGMANTTVIVDSIDINGTGGVKIKDIARTSMLYQVHNFNDTTAGRFGITSDAGDINFNSNIATLTSNRGFSGYDYIIPVNMPNGENLRFVKVEFINITNASVAGLYINGILRDTEPIIPNSAEKQTVIFPVNTYIDVANNFVNGQINTIQLDTAPGDQNKGSQLLYNVELYSYGNANNIGTVALDDHATQSYEYTGNVQEFVAPETAEYLLQGWGASGGDGVDFNQGAGSHAGLGGYAAGYRTLNKGEKIYVYVGGVGTYSTGLGVGGGYNGGGHGGPGGYGGGGMTHFSLTKNPSTTVGVDDVPISGQQSFDFTGYVQEFTAPITGTYTFKLYGASGGDGRVVNVNTLVQNSGGAGAYAEGTKQLNKGDKIYIYVGGKGEDANTISPYAIPAGGFNGGGTGGTELSGEEYPENSAGGGGASDIRIGGTSLDNRVIVAAGGGGAGSHFSSTDINADSYGKRSLGGDGGVTNGADAGLETHSTGGAQTGNKSGKQLMFKAMPGNGLAGPNSAKTSDKYWIVDNTSGATSLHVHTGYGGVPSSPKGSVTTYTVYGDNLGNIYPIMSTKAAPNTGNWGGQSAQLVYDSTTSDGHRRTFTYHNTGNDQCLALCMNYGNGAFQVSEVDISIEDGTVVTSNFSNYGQGQNGFSNLQSKSGYNNAGSSGGNGGGYYGGYLDKISSNGEAFGGAGGSSYVGGVDNGKAVAGQNRGNGRVEIKWSNGKSNSSTTVTTPARTITLKDPNSVSHSQDFGYTGKIQQFTAPMDNYYTFEAWGASGAGQPGQDNMIGQGGYTKGTTYLKAGQTVYIQVGEKGKYIEKAADPTPAAKEFGYTGNVQEYTIPQSGYYKLEAWGAQGYQILDGTAGKGGYTYGQVNLTAGQIIYVVVGGANGYNGGEGDQPGGGATHIATSYGALASLASNQDSVLIVAGGGGGAERVPGGAGGGGNNNGGMGNSNYDGGTRTPTGGTQTSGGSAGHNNNGGGSSNGEGGAGSFGRGGHGGIGGDVGPTGGAGWYGGGGIPYAGGAGGGSGHVNKSRVVNYGGSNGVQYGNGHAKITFVGDDIEVATGTYNGGGDGGASMPVKYDNGSHLGGSGGGATDFRIVAGTATDKTPQWADKNSLRSRILVAGGGGGAGCASSHNPGNGGGLTGATTVNTGYYKDASSTGGTQTEGGHPVGPYVDTYSGYTSGTGEFGIGANAWQCGAGGGGGYYGGGSGYTSGGGGGSSYVSGYAGCDTSYLSAQGGFAFTNVEMRQGGNVGDGKARVSWTDNTPKDRTVSIPASTKTIDGMLTRVMPDGTRWARILYQDLSHNTNYFSSSNEAEQLDSNLPGKFSALGELERFRKPNGTFEFMLDYPDATGIFAGKHNRWIQSTNPFTEQRTNGGNSRADAVGYKAVDVQMDVAGIYGHGLERNGGVRESILDGSVNHDNWWLAVGQLDSTWDSVVGNRGFTPGPISNVANTPTQNVSETELWVRVDDCISTIEDNNKYWNPKGTLLVAGGGGGADNAGGAVGGGDDGSGGAGGGLEGGEAYVNGKIASQAPELTNRTRKPAIVENHGGSGLGGTQNAGFIQGSGESVTCATDTGGAGAGWYGGFVSNDNNGGGAGGSSYIGGVSSGTTLAGQNAGNGRATVTMKRYIPPVLTSYGPGATVVGTKSSASAEDVRAVIDKIKKMADLEPDQIPDAVDGYFNPLFDCNRLYNRHSCKIGNCHEIKILSCTEPHHYGGHYETNDEAKRHNGKICYDPCYDDSKHKIYKEEFPDLSGGTTKAEKYINHDEYFDIFFPNMGDFYESDLHGIPEVTQTRGMSYENDMDTSYWTREKYVKFDVDVLFYREETGLWEQYPADNWIELPVMGHNYPYYHFYCTLNNAEKSSASVTFESEAINADDSVSKYNYKNWAKGTPFEHTDLNSTRGNLDSAFASRVKAGANASAINIDGTQYSKFNGGQAKYNNTAVDRAVANAPHGAADFIYANYNIFGTQGKTASNHLNDNDGNPDMTNKDRFVTYRSYHGASKKYFYDVVGRIGNLFITDTDDPRYSNVFKIENPNGNWVMQNLIREVFPDKPNYYLAWYYANEGGNARDVRNRPVANTSNMYNTWDTQLWNGYGEYKDKNNQNRYHSAYRSATYDQSVALPVESNSSKSKKANAVKKLLLKPGYNVFFEVTTTGNYQDKLNITPYYYALCVNDDGAGHNRGDLIPVDVYMNSSTDDADSVYVPINLFGETNYTEAAQEAFNGDGKNDIFSYDMSLEWNDEKARRMFMTDEPDLGENKKGLSEEDMTKNLHDMMTRVDENGATEHLTIPGAVYYSLGNTQLLTPDGNARTFIGTSRTVFENTTFNGRDDTNFDNRFGSELYNYRAQRWHLKLGLPTSAVFTFYDGNKHIQPLDKVEYKGDMIPAYQVIQGLDDTASNYAIVMTANIKSIGSPWNLAYEQNVGNGDPQDVHSWSNGTVTISGNTFNFGYIGPSKFESFGKSGTTKVESPDEFRVILALYTPSSSSEVDYDIIGVY